MLQTIFHFSLTFISYIFFSGSVETTTQEDKLTKALKHFFSFDTGETTPLWKRETDVRVLSTKAEEWREDLSWLMYIYYPTITYHSCSYNPLNVLILRLNIFLHMFLQLLTLETFWYGTLNIFLHMLLELKSKSYIFFLRASSMVTLLNWVS